MKNLTGVLLILLVAAAIIPSYAELTKEELETKLQQQAAEIEQLKEAQAEKERSDYLKEQDAREREYYRASQERTYYNSMLRRQAEAERRARFGAALQAWGALAQQQQQQELYRQLNRPRTINCNTYGAGYSSNTHCTSY